VQEVSERVAEWEARCEEQMRSDTSHSHTELSISLAAARARVSELEGLCDRHRQEVHAREASLRDAEHASALRVGAGAQARERAARHAPRRELRAS
jgi:chromosome segregation ATPase